MNKFNLMNKWNEWNQINIIKVNWAIEWRQFIDEMKSERAEWTKRIDEMSCVEKQRSEWNQLLKWMEQVGGLFFLLLAGYRPEASLPHQQSTPLN